MRGLRNRSSVEICEGIGAYWLPGVVDWRGMFRLEIIRLSSAPRLFSRITTDPFSDSYRQTATGT